ncbi:hypothetical protein BC826DRAFT_1089142 [Russula brevipes]|nr:hypothetical protein BC826DRAFT_1089142 [Russula brevipes]
MKVFWDPDCLLHDPPYEILSGDKSPYFESPARLQSIKKELEQHPSLFSFESASSSSTDSESESGLDITRYVEMVHSREYLSYLSNAYENWVQSGGDPDAVLPETFPHPKLLPGPIQGQAGTLSTVAQAGYYCFDLSAPITQTTYSSVIASVGVALSAAQELATASRPHGAKTGVFALCRPPGHHAGTSLCGGYCFVNNVAVAARFLQCLNPEPAKTLPIAILDIDYHHGNGTQEIFYSDPSVLYVSLHAENDYPSAYYYPPAIDFTGAVTEKGTGEGMNTNLNYPLPQGTQDSDYCTALLKAAEDIRRFDPGLGVDTFADDPINLGRPTLFIMEG